MESFKLTIDDLPRHTHGVEIYGGFYPNGSPVKRPCKMCQKFNGISECAPCDPCDHKTCFVKK